MMTLEEVITTAKEVSENQSIYVECKEEHKQLLKQLTDWLEELKALREKSRWIPCSERLPENDIKEVLVWFEFRYGAYNRPYQTIGISYTYKGKWRGLINGESEWKDLKVIAWMPLPEPYKEKNRMTNREYMINLLLDGLESRLNRVSIDDGGASEEAMIYYNINCPYYAGDKRAYCRKEGSLEPSREVCVDCKAHWLEQEVDE